MANRAATQNVALEWQQFLTIIVFGCCFFSSRKKHICILSASGKRKQMLSFERKNSDYGKVGPKAGRQQLLAQIFRESPLRLWG